MELVCSNPTCENTLHQPKCRVETSKYKLFCCSASCRKSSNFKIIKNNILIEHRGYPTGFSNKETYDRYLAYQTNPKNCLTCDKTLTYKQRNGESCSQKCAAIRKDRISRIKNTKLKKYGSEGYNNRKQAKATCQEKYGVDNPQQIAEVNQRAKKTNIKKYGVDNPAKSQEIKNKIANSLMKKYGVSNYFKQTDKVKEHWNDALGVDNPQQHSEIKQKTLETVKEKYGELVGCMPKEQTENTCLEKYGKKSFFASDQGKMTFQNLKENYGWSDEQLNELGQKKNNSTKFKCGRASKESLKYFVPLYKLLRRKYNILRQNIHIGVGRNSELYLYNKKELKGFLYDFTVMQGDTKFIIEYNGVKFHPHPDIHGKNFELYEHPFRKDVSAIDEYNRNKSKIQLAKDNGFAVLEIWSNDTTEHNTHKINEFIEEHIK